jgi:TolB protein
MVINADGSGLRRLTSGIDPVLSPDGRQVAFTRWEGDIGTLWTINVDGSNERSILGGMRKAKGPEWSPDGSQIILNFQQGGYVEARQECVALKEGSFPRLPRNATDVKVVVDGEGNFKLCFTLPPDPHWSLRLVNLSEGSFQDLYGGQYAFRPAWDPAQPWRVVSDAGNGLLAIDINRDDYRQYLTEELLDGSPAFSPDGRFIATTTANQGGYDLYRLNADGGGRIRLTETPLWVPIQPESEGEVWHNVSPVWSPDSAQIAFLTNREGPWQIWLMAADGSNQRPMFPPEVNQGLNIQYNFVDERVLSWR